MLRPWGGLALGAPPCLLDPAIVHEARGAQLVGSTLALEVGADQRDEVLLEVHLTQALVPVGEHGEADDDVGVGELRGCGGHVLAQEGNGELEA
eukprot:scaffold123977_cov48-Phaeocystis_antarctica.AAC.1